MNDENLDKSYNYDLICGKNIATNKVSLLKMTTLSQNTMQNDLLMNIYLYYTNIILTVLGKQMQIVDFMQEILLYLREDFAPRIKRRKDKIMELIRGIDDKVQGVELLVYNKNKEKSLKVNDLYS